MRANSEPVLLTLLDVMMILGVTGGFIAVPASLISREFRIAAKTTLAILGVIAANAAVHAVASLMQS